MDDEENLEDYFELEEEIVYVKEEVLKDRVSDLRSENNAPKKAKILGQFKIFTLIIYLFMHSWKRNQFLIILLGLFLNYLGNFLILGRKLLKNVKKCSQFSVSNA